MHLPEAKASILRGLAAAAMADGSLWQLAQATRVSYHVATLRLVKEALVKQGDDYLRPAEKMALLGEDVRCALAMYAAEDATTVVRRERRIARVATLSRAAFRRDFMYKNEPVLVERGVVDEGWGLGAFRGADGAFDAAAMAAHVGDCAVPVRDAATQASRDVPFRDFAATMVGDARYYLKDWHFRVDGFGPLAPVPPLFDDDWLSGERDMDYHFLYLGAAGTGTRLHCDVINSFSWSANVFGSKRWRFLPAEETALLRDAFGEDVADAFGPSSVDFPRRGLAEPIEVLQPPGSVIFVPSGWYHDVENATDALSVNCNWINGANCLWAPPRLADDEAARGGDVSRAQFLRKVSRAIAALALRCDDDAAVDLAAAGAVAARLGDVALQRTADAALRALGAGTSSSKVSAALDALAEDPSADASVLFAADGSDASDSDSDSDGFLGRIDDGCFDDDDDAKVRRAPIKRGWTPGFREQVDLGVREFDFPLAAGAVVTCGIEYRDAGTGSSVWDGAVVLARFLERAPAATVAGRAVLELGSGTGFVGLVAAALGAASVVLTDLPQCLPLIQANVDRNGDLAKQATVEGLPWGGPPPKRRADAVLVADCLLPGCEGLFEPLCRTLAGLLRDADQVAYFVYEQRCMDCGPFFDLVADAGLDAGPVDDAALHPDFSAPEIHLLEIRRRPPAAQ